MRVESNPALPVKTISLYAGDTGNGGLGDPKVLLRGLHRMPIVVPTERALKAHGPAREILHPLEDGLEHSKRIRVLGHRRQSVEHLGPERLELRCLLGSPVVRSLHRSEVDGLHFVHR